MLEYLGSAYANRCRCGYYCNLELKTPDNEMDILMFGGNGFLGGATARLLLKQNYRVTVVNRGKSWDWDKANTIQPYVDCIEWDRKRSMTQCTALNDLLQKGKLRAVIDFSSYKGIDVKDACKCIKDKTELYIYISTDSVYEVCEKNHEGFAKESDAVRPSSKDTYSTLKKLDSYGHEKLKGEEELLKAQKQYNFKYVILRLADVVGPCDSTDRWWSLQLWITWCVLKDEVFYLPLKRKDTLLSFVYVEDVAQLLVTLILDVTKKTQSQNEEKYNNVFNLAIAENPSLETFIQDLSQLASGKPVKIEYTDSPIADFYPSVENGPIDICRATRLLSWKPTAWKCVLENTVRFYNEVPTDEKYYQERKEIYEEVINDLRDIYKKTDLEAIASILNISL